MVFRERSRNGCTYVIQSSIENTIKPFASELPYAGADHDLPAPSFGHHSPNVSHGTSQAGPLYRANTGLVSGCYQGLLMLRRLQPTLAQESRFIFFVHSIFAANDLHLRPLRESSIIRFTLLDLHLTPLGFLVKYFSSATRMGSTAMLATCSTSARAAASAAACARAFAAALSAVAYRAALTFLAVISTSLARSVPAVLF